MNNNERLKEIVQKALKFAILNAGSISAEEVLKDYIGLNAKDMELIGLPEFAYLVDDTVTVKVTNIVYCVEEEDVDVDPHEYETTEDYLAAIDEAIGEAMNELPKEMTIKLSADSAGSLEDDIADVISDETGWLVESFSYEVM